MSAGRALRVALAAMLMVPAFGAHARGNPGGARGDQPGQTASPSAPPAPRQQQQAAPRQPGAEPAAAGRDDPAEAGRDGPRDLGGNLEDLRQEPPPAQDSGAGLNYFLTNEQPPAEKAESRSSSYYVEIIAVVAQTLLAALLGGLLGFFLFRSKFSKTLQQRDKELENELLKLDRKIDALSRAVADRDSGKSAPEPRDPNPFGGPPSFSSGRREPDQRGLAGGTDLSATRAEPALPTAEDEAWLTRAYRDLFGEGGPKLRDVKNIFGHFSQLRGFQVTESGRIEAGSYSGDNPNELLAALSNGGDLLIVPTFDYLNNFGALFNLTVQNPPLIERFFRMEADGSGQFRLVAPARARINEAGQIQIVRQGHLAGFIR